LEAGNLTVFSAFPVDVQDGPYQRVLEVFDIKGGTAKELVEASRTIALDDVLANLHLTFPARPTGDGYIVDWAHSFADMDSKNPQLFPE